MKRLKFRAWHEKLERMIYDLSVDADGASWTDETGKEWSIEVDDIMQSTGLKDKNGKEIYEGDVVKYHDSTTMWLTSQVVDVGGAFAVTTSENPILLHDWVKDYFYDGQPILELEIIGNVHENPELVSACVVADSR